MLQVPRVNTTFGKTAFSFSAPYTNILRCTFKFDTVIPIGQFKTAFKLLINWMQLLTMCCCVWLPASYAFFCPYSLCDYVSVFTFYAPTLCLNECFFPKIFFVGGGGGLKKKWMKKKEWILPKNIKSLSAHPHAIHFWSFTWKTGLEHFS